MPKINKRKQTRIPGVKRPKSGYTYFCNETWEQMKKHVLENAPPQEGTKLQCAIMKELSLRWTAMTPKEKVKFEKKAAVDSKRYHKEKMEYMKTQPPKRPRNNPYIYFFRDMQCQIRKKHPEMKQSQIAQEVAHLWPKVKSDPQQVKKYTASFEADLKKYNRKMQCLAAQ